MWRTNIERLSGSRWRVTVLLASLIPLLAAAFQSAWIVLLRHTRIYQAVLCPYDPESNDVDYWLWHAVLLPQMVVAVALLCPLIRFPGAHRLVGIVVFAACLYYDCFVVTRWVIR